MNKNGNIRLKNVNWKSHVNSSSQFVDILILPTKNINRRLFPHD